MSGFEERPQSDEVDSDETSLAGTQQAQSEAEAGQEELKAQLERARLKVELGRAEKEIKIQEKKLKAELDRAKKEVKIQDEKLQAALDRTILDAELRQTNLKAALWRAKLKKYASYIGGVLLALIVIPFVGYILVKTYNTTARDNERLDELARQVDLLKTPMPTISSPGLDEHRFQK
jgi:HAMP domain-containing protein